MGHLGARPEEIDLQCQSIKDGLDSLADLTREPVARNALDVDHNVEISHALEVLRRLRNSLNQYMGRTGELFYVSCTGHFSSGKSSTINSLCSLWGTSDARQVA